MCECRHMAPNGKCKKYSNRGRKCDPTTKEGFVDAEPVEMIDVGRVCEHSSIFGNSLCYITKEQLLELAAGKVMHFHDGEYGWFVILSRENA